MWNLIERIFFIPTIPLNLTISIILIYRIYKRDGMIGLFDEQNTDEMIEQTVPDWHWLFEILLSVSVWLIVIFTFIN